MLLGRARPVAAVGVLHDEAGGEHLLDGLGVVVLPVGLPLGLPELGLQLGDDGPARLGLGLPILLLLLELLQLGAGPPTLAANLEQGGRVSLLGRHGGGVEDDRHDLRVHLDVEVVAVG